MIKNEMRPIEEKTNSLVNELTENSTQMHKKVIKSDL